MLRPAFIGALAPLLLVGWPAVAGLRTPIAGANPVLPARFTPMRYEVAGPVGNGAPSRGDAADAEANRASSPIWAFPLVDRRLTSAEKAAALAPELLEAVGRIEPMYDPTRLDGTGAAPPLAISAGTASMNNVFADRWRRTDPDANVDAKVRVIAMAWQDVHERPCDAFTKSRPHGLGEPELTALSPTDCEALLAYETRGSGDAPPVPLVAAWIGVPVFAAPLPGSRMTSDAFWAARRARIAEVQARLRQRWTAGMPSTEAIDQR